MSLVSTPLKNDIATQKDIFRLAATLFSETSDVYSEAETQLQIIKCMFATNNNRFMNRTEIVVGLLEQYKYHITEDEVFGVLKKAKGVFVRLDKEDGEAYKLTDEEYNKTKENQEKNIDYYIDEYIEINEVPDGEKCKDAIHQYLYELTTTNINSYKVILAGKDSTAFSDSDLSVNLSELSDAEKQHVKRFLDWDNKEKTDAIGNLIFCCLEYCLLINGDSPNSFVKKYVKRREIYLDTNVIFRALGINGESRQRVVIAFLDKCKQAKIRLKISFHTQTEFKDTIKHNISQIATYPSGNVCDGAYERLSDKSIFSFYVEWRKTHPSLSLTYFHKYVLGLYSALVNKYDILDGEKIPKEIFDSEDFKECRKNYSNTIREQKNYVATSYTSDDEYYSQRDIHDATIVRYAELLREKYSDERDVFVVSSDKALRYWDMTRDQNQFPIVVYPSQLFLLLIKMCGRSTNDFESFVSFINIRPSGYRITPEKANIIISGISSITEDLEAQESIISAVVSEDFQKIIQHSQTDDELYQNVQSLSQNFLSEQLAKKEKALKKANREIKKKNQKIAKKDAELKAVNSAKNDEVQELERIHQEEIEKRIRDDEANKEKMCKMAEKAIKCKFIIKWYVIPICVALLTLAALLFTVFQFFWCDEPWNIAKLFFDWAKQTMFGKAVGDFLYVIDGVIWGGMYFVYKKSDILFFKRKELMEKDKLEMIQAYIEKIS